ncbi:MAG: rhomboid family intramembrane serine protease [Bryobacterales bacterium]
MAYYSRQGPMGPVGYSFGGLVPRGVKWLLIVNSILFVVYFLANALRIGPLVALFHWLSLIPDAVIRGALWQPFTYLFLHSPYGFFHVLFNMLALWMFGSDLERDWGMRRFLNFYFFCGVGAGLCDVVARLVLGDGAVPTIGASGAIYGVLLAFGLLYPTRTIYVALVFPIPARIFVMVLGGIAFLMSIAGAVGPGTGVAHVAHLGGMLFGYFYLRYKPDFLDIDWLASYRRWQLRRAQRKFEVYMRKRDGSGGGGWVN